MPGKGHIPNLVPHHFKKGQSGNPAGRPKGSKNGLRARIQAQLKKRPNATLATILKMMGVRARPSDNAEALAQILLGIAIGPGLQEPKDRLAAIKIILEQTEKPLTQSIQLDTSPVTFILPPKGDE